jgi:hypothetical protein
MQVGCVPLSERTRAQRGFTGRQLCACGSLVPLAGDHRERVFVIIGFHAKAANTADMPVANLLSMIASIDR